MASYKNIKQISIREGLYPIKVSLTVWDDGNSEPFIDLYSGVPGKNKGQPYKHNHFKITKKHTWERIKKIIDEGFIKGLSKSEKPLPNKTIEKQVLQDVERLKNDKNRLEQTVKKLSTLIKENRKNNLPEYETDIKQFKLLIKKAKRENQLQNFLAKRPWLLGLEYENSTPQKIAPGQRYDFYVEKYDGYADIIEIKKANTPVFDTKGKITKGFADAIYQLINYIDDALYYGDNNRLSEKMKFNFLKPRGILIIGKDTDVSRLQNLKYYFHNIDILTYSEVLLRGENIVKRLKSENKKSGLKK